MSQHPRPAKCQPEPLFLLRTLRLEHIVIRNVLTHNVKPVVAAHLTYEFELLSQVFYEISERIVRTQILLKKPILFIKLDHFPGVVSNRL